MVKLGELLGRNRSLKLAALLGGVVIWSYLESQPSFQRPFEAGIHYVNVPSDLELDPDQVDRVTVIVKGRREQLDELGRRELTVDIDFSDIYRPGEHTVNVTAESLRLPPALQLVKAVPSQLRLYLEARVRRQVAVQPHFVGTYQPGYYMESHTVTPPQLVVVGPESRMELIDQVSTDPIDVSGVVGRATFQAMAYVADPYVRFDGEATVTVEVNVRKRQ